MKSFIQSRFFDLDPEADIIEAYSDYEKEVLQADIEEFAAENELSNEFISTALHQYFIDNRGVTKEALRQSLVANGVTGLLKITSLINRILTFFADCYNKFTADGD